MADFDANVGYDPAALSWTYSSAAMLSWTSHFHEEYELVGARAIELLNAAKRLTHSGSPYSINNAITALRKCCRAIAQRCASSESPAEWIEAFQEYLRSQKNSEHTRWSDFNHGQRIVREAARFRNIEVDAANPFRRRRISKLALVSKADQQRLISQARQDALKYYRDFQQPAPEVAEMLNRARAFAEQNGGILPSSAGAKGQWLRFLTEAKEHGVSVLDIQRCLYATADTLMPFHVLITYKLAANVDAVSSIRVDAVTEFDNPMLGKRYAVKLEKPRSGDMSPYTVSESGTLSIPWIIKAVLEMTEPIRAFVTEDQRERLFVGVTAQGNVRLLTGNLCSATFKRYARRCGLTTVQLKHLRPSRGIDEFLRTGDIFRVKRILKHKHLSTTLPYLDHRSVDDVGDELIANVQSSILSSEQRKKPEERPASGVSGSISHACADPRNSVDGMHDEFGLCSQLLWPLNDRHFVMSLEPRSVAFFLRDYATLCEAEKRIVATRFVQQGYAARKHLMESRYLPQIDQPLRLEAEALVPTLPPAPWID